MMKDRGCRRFPCGMRSLLCRCPESQRGSVNDQVPFGPLCLLTPPFMPAGVVTSAGPASVVDDDRHDWPEARRSVWTSSHSMRTRSQRLSHRKAQAAAQLRMGPNGGHRATTSSRARTDGRPLEPNSLSREFRLAAAAAGLRRIRLHDLRHTHASLLLADGEPIGNVSRRIGHADSHITAQVYEHYVPGAQKATAARFRDMLQEGHEQGELRPTCWQMLASRHPWQGWGDGKPAFSSEFVEPTRGIEPRTPSLRVMCSAS